MFIKIEKFKQGTTWISLEAEVDGEASGKMLDYARESVKTACMSALDHAIGKTLEKGVVYKRALHFNETTALLAFKLPEGVKSAKVSVVGEWAPTAGGTSKAAQAAATMKAMREKGLDEAIIASVLASMGLDYSAPVAAAPTPSEAGEAEIVEG